MKVSIEVNAKFRYLWMKHISGVYLSKHCAGCLKGEYSKSVNPSMSKIEGLQLEDGVWYLCGVSSPYKWDKNFHLAFHDCPGRSFTFDWNGIKVRIEDGEHLPISNDFIDATLPQSKKKEFATCRNWQFANWLATHGQHLLPQ